MRSIPCALAVMVVLAGCGGGDGPVLPKGTPDADAKQAAQAYVDAYANHDAAAICAALTRLVQRQLATDKGTCLRTIRVNIAGQSYPRVQVDQAYADGRKATATIVDSKRQIALLRDPVAWKVSNGGL